MAKRRRELVNILMEDGDNLRIVVYNWIEMRIMVGGIRGT